MLFVLSCFTLHAQSNFTFTDYDLSINYFLFSGVWQKADSLVKVKIIEEPNNPKYNFMRAYVAFYTRFVGNNNPYDRAATIRQVRNCAWKAIINGEKLEESVENNFYLGSAYALLSRVNIMSGEYWIGYWNASKAENYFEDVIESDPDVSDAYLNLGINEYFPAVNITGFQSFLAWLGGMSGDREEGLSDLRRTAENGVLFKNEANYILGLAYSFGENDLNKGHEYWSYLKEKFPENNFYTIQYDRSHFAILIDEKGVDFLTAEYDSLETVYGINNPNILNTVGYSLLNQERYREALTVFETNIKKYPDIANGYDSLAECYMTMGDNKNAVKFYTLAYEKLKSDTTITNEFRERLEEGIKNNLDELGG